MTDHFKSGNNPGPWSILFIMLLSAVSVGIITVFRIIRRMLDFYEFDTITLKAGKIILQPGSRHINLTELLILEDFIWHFLLPLIIVWAFARLQNWRWKVIPELKKLRQSSSILTMTMGMAAIVTVVSLFEPGASHGMAMTLRLLEENSLWTSVLILGILVPITEEIMFRGLLYDFFNKVLSPVRPWAGIILTAIVFTVLHYQYNLDDLIPFFIISLVLSVSRWQSKGVIVPVALHIFLNTGTILLLTF